MRVSEQIQHWKQADRLLAVDWADGHHSVFHYIWLRDNCPCRLCRHPNGQRLLDTATIPPDITPARLSQTADGAIEVIWAPDEHCSQFAPAWLRANCYSAVARGQRRPSIAQWGAEIAGRLPRADYATIASQEAALRDWLMAIEQYGFALLHGVPTTPGMVVEVVKLFGYVRETNYGRLFDVKSVVNPNNLAYTGLALGGHTDNPYRDPTPSLQLLHCLSSSTDGGDNTLVDGFQVAERLRAAAPEQFGLLTRQPIRFRFQDEDADLSAEFPLISLDARGEVAAIHYNSRSPAPFDLEEPLVEPFYAAYRAFVGLLGSPEFQIKFKLGPGDLFIVDNWRVLHGRTGFSAAGQRHLQGCYADRDGLRSRLAVLNRNLKTPADIIREIFEAFEAHGDQLYIGEPVSMTEHMLQAAYGAELDGAGSILVAAALLHDFGHLIHGQPEDSAEHGVDTQHEEVGAAYLSRYFVPAVVEPTRMHVAAKRYLCAVDPAYFATLSEASVLSLKLQGGPFTPDEARAFEARPFAAEAARLRRYDDAAKVAGAWTPNLDHYRPSLEAGLQPTGPSGQ